MAEVRCEMTATCGREATMIEEKGWVYCDHHGLERRSYGHRVRKLRAYELNRLRRGEQVKRY